MLYTTSEQTVLAGALKYAEQGVRLYPCDNRKRPLVKHWNTFGSTSDPQVVEKWFARDLPDANVGIACGPSRLAVVDVDPRNRGTESFKALVDRFGPDCFSAPRVKTPGGGFHLYFTAAGKTPSGQIAHGVDLQAEGKGVLAPPSRIADRRYVWETLDGWMETGEIPSLDPAIIDLVRQTQTETTLRRLPHIIAKGDRNRAMTRLAGRFCLFGHTQEEINGMLQAINERRCSPPLSESEIAKIAKSMAARRTRVDPADWLLAWYPYLSGSAREIATFYWIVAERGVPEIRPALKHVLSQTGFSEPTYYQARDRLQEAGAVRCVRHGRNSATEIILEMPKQPTAPLNSR